MTKKTVFIVGAGFSYHAGLPLTSGFTDAILEARNSGDGPSRLIVDFLSRFIRETFDCPAQAGGRRWPDLEDIFTCVDLSANSGHHLGADFAPADLRTVRRAMLARIIRMLDQRYQSGRRKKDVNWRSLDNFFARIDLNSAAFISMNWDTVIERKIQLERQKLLINYGCDASPAAIPDRPILDDYRSSYQYEKKLQKPQTILTSPLTREEIESSIPVVKIHGSSNWLYCDNCRQLFWFHPDQSNRIADQLIRQDDLRRMERLLNIKKRDIEEKLEYLKRMPPASCLCSDSVPLSIRIATFSYRKALDFPMFHKSWLHAEKLLRAADKWVFIGYSLPPADYEFKYLLKRVQVSRNNRPQIVVVSGGSTGDLSRTYDNYWRFFGNSINKSIFFRHGLNNDAVSSICK